MRSHDTPINHPFTSAAWHLLAVLCETARPHDQFSPDIAEFCAAHLSELHRLALGMPHRDAAIDAAFHLAPTGRTLLRNRVYVNAPMPDAAR